MYGINSDTTEGTRSSVRRHWKYRVPEIAFLSFSVQERAGEINRGISNTASDWMQYSHLVTMREEGTVIVYHLSEAHLPWHGEGEDHGQTKVPCILSVLTPTSQKHLQGSCRAGKHAPCAGLGSLAMQRDWYPAAGHLPLQPRKTFAKLLQLFSHINHFEGKALLSLKSH